jgi:hypothetical protein
MRMVSTTVLLALGSAGVATVRAQDFEFRRELAAGSRFVLRNIIGDVRIEGTSGRTVEVSASKKEGRYGDPEDVEIRTFDLDGGVAICVFYPGQYSRNSRNRDRDDRDDRADRDDRDDGNVRNRRVRSGRRDDPCSREGNWSNNNRNDTSVDFVVRLPAGLDVDAKTVSGDLIGQGLRGRLDLGTVSGNLQLTDAEGEVLEASSVSGDVELDRITAREVGAETVSGDVTFVGPIDPKGSYDFKTLSGDVIVTLPREPDAQVSAVTFSGRLVSDFPVQMDGRRRRNRFSATWGSGSAQLDLESFSGDVRIRSGTSSR